MERLRKKIKRIDKEMTEINPSLRRTSATISGILVASMVVNACAPKESEGAKIETGNNNSSENIPSSENLSKEQIAQQTLDNFIASHPEYQNREAGVVNFIVNGVDASTVVLKTTENEKNEISKREYKFGDLELTPFTGAIVWSKMTDFNRNETWVRLAGVQYKLEDGSINTVWYSSPYVDYTEVDTDVNFNRKVFAFNSRDDEYAYWPMVNPPTKIVWSDDMTQTDPSKYEFWNGNDPYMLQIVEVVNGGSKALFEVVSVESQPKISPEVQVEFDKSEFYSLNPNGQIEMDLGDGGTKIIPDIQVQPDGTMTFTYEGQEFTADTETLTVNGGMITFKDKANPEKTWRIIDGEWAMAELDINPVHTETAQGEFMGVTMKVNLITDKSLDPSITKIEADPTYTNQYGEKFNDAMLHFTAMTFYKVWLEKGGPNGEGPETEVSFDEYMTMWAEAQNGQRPWSDMQITILANEIATEGYDAKPTVIYPFYVEGENVEKPPQGVRTIDEFSITAVKARKIKNMVVVNEDLQLGYGSNLLDSNLYIYIGYNTSSSAINTEKFFVENLSVAAKWINTHTEVMNFDRNLVLTLSNGGNTINRFKSVFDIYPER